MSEQVVTTDAPIMDLLRRGGPMTVAELAEAMEVTATAIRQRLSRLLAKDLVERRVVKAGRGRPSHRYRLTEKGNRMAGANFDDLALAAFRALKRLLDDAVAHLLGQPLLPFDKPDTGRRRRRQLQHLALFVHDFHFRNDVLATAQILKAQVFETESVGRSRRLRPFNNGQNRIVTFDRQFFSVF